MNLTDRFALLCATVAVHRLEVETTVHPEDRQRERVYLVHRAALADRAVPALAELEHPRISLQDAEDTARRLLEHDRAHATGRGPVPATDARWDTDPRGSPARSTPPLSSVTTTSNPPEVQCCC